MSMLPRTKQGRERFVFSTGLFVTLAAALVASIVNDDWTWLGGVASAVLFAFALLKLITKAADWADRGDGEW